MFAACLTPHVRSRFSSPRSALFDLWRRFAPQQHSCSTGAKSWSVSSHGRCRTSRGHITLGYLNPTKYRSVCICKHNFLVHRMVVQAFLGPPVDSAAWQVHHRDGNPSNNCLNNLEYVTPSQNIQHSFNSNLDRRTSRPHSKPVMWKPVGSQMWRMFPSLAAAAQQLGMSRRTIAKHCESGTQIGDVQLKFAALTESPVLPGEQWLPMVSPTTGQEIVNRRVSSCGRVSTRYGWISRGYQSSSGYSIVSIGSNDKFRVHRLVARAFLGPPPSPLHSHVNHKDSNRANNYVDNLEYATPSENQIHSYSVQHSRKTCAEATSIPVLGRTQGSNDKWTWYPSMSSASRALGVNVGSIVACCRGLTKRAGKHEFRLDTEGTTTEDLPGEEWRIVDLQRLLEEKNNRALGAS